MFFIKQQQSASCTQLLITHQTRKASSLSCRQEAAFQAKIQQVWVLLDQHSDSATLTLRMNLLSTHLPTQGCTLIMDPVLHLFNRLLPLEPLGVHCSGRLQTQLQDLLASLPTIS
ncbi:hypothetical protein CesoFtcFv8_026558 [Champsocephalus esox]|uniref:Uncharacterized protein n=1 Tax=Champsocephalus esox TaxID=159716 RepID=A0AAN8AZU1_9TELE|nr:hypothetical protein CesoFtcFv8_026558 [Champsocephalus esox]